jgi:hypothetical protein
VLSQQTSVFVPAGTNGLGGSFCIWRPGSRKSSGETDLDMLIPLQPQFTRTISIRSHPRRVQVDLGARSILICILYVTPAPLIQLYFNEFRLFGSISSSAHPAGDARESASRRLRFASASRPFPCLSSGRSPSERLPPRTPGLEEPRCQWGRPGAIMTRRCPNPWPPRPAEPRPRLPHAVYKRCTSDVPGMHMRQPLVHPWCIAGTPLVHGARQCRAASWGRWAALKSTGGMGR